MYRTANTSINFNRYASVERVRLDKNTKRGRGRPPLAQQFVDSIRRMRLAGLTVQSIAEFLGLSIPTVFKYSIGISNLRRWNRTIKTHRRTGMQAA